MIKKVIAVLIAALVVGLSSPAVFADTSTSTAAAQLQSQIDQHNSMIQELQTEIAQYQSELNKTSVQAKTLQAAINALDLNIKKLDTSIQLTENQIESASETITQLGGQISTKQQEIDDSQKAIAETIQDINESDSESPLETILEYPTISTFWDVLETREKFQSSLGTFIDQLKGLKQGLIQNQQQTTVQKSSLEQLKGQLTDQQQAIVQNKKQQSSLLTTTKSKESAYQNLIAEKKANEESFENDLTQYESQLKGVLNPASIPAANSTLLAWPLDQHVITQYFGNTSFSQQHAAVYNGQGHDGIDIAASIGTPVKSAGDGYVMGTGDTDDACPNASYGNWILIKHTNGLATLYGHLSLIKVSQGDAVTTGEIIGLSGETGYATGPHLHFTVMAGAAAQVANLASKGCPGAVYVMPVATLSAYLNPMEYLPAP
jgi:murein DD-endopeptidase MepM/ murein hydrolase activator NlpD